MSVYASLFKEHHITGKQLLLLEEEDLKDMGIVSRGHIIHLKVLSAYIEWCSRLYCEYHRVYGVSVLLAAKKVTKLNREHIWYVNRIIASYGSRTQSNLSIL